MVPRSIALFALASAAFFGAATAQLDACSQACLDNTKTKFADFGCTEASDACLCANPSFLNSARDCAQQTPCAEGMPAILEQQIGSMCAAVTPGLTTTSDAPATSSPPAETSLPAAEESSQAEAESATATTETTPTSTDASATSTDSASPSSATSSASPIPVGSEDTGDDASDSETKDNQEEETKDNDDDAAAAAGMSVGAKAGIGAGVAVAVVALVGLLFFFLRRRKQQGGGRGGGGDGGAAGNAQRPTISAPVRAGDFGGYMEKGPYAGTAHDVPNGPGRMAPSPPNAAVAVYAGAPSDNHRHHNYPGGPIGTAVSTNHDPSDFRSNRYEDMLPRAYPTSIV